MRRGRSGTTFRTAASACRTRRCAASSRPRLRGRLSSYISSTLARMTDSPQKNLVTRLADAGEEAIQRLGGAPGGDRVVGAVNTLRNRVDEMQRRLRGVDEL